MKNTWLKFGCFLTGYDYKILNNCSEVSKKSVKKITSALLIIMVVWGFVGYMFTHKYIGLSSEYSIFGSLIMIILVVQIERQIILTIGSNGWSKVFRFILALIMAILGSMIVDQILFQDDIKLQQDIYLQDKVDRIVIVKEKSIKTQISDIDSSLIVINNEIQILNDRYQKNPMVSNTESTSEKIQLKTINGIDSVNNDGLPVMKWVTTGVKNIPVPNPIVNEINMKNGARLDKLQRLKELNNDLIIIRKNVESDIKPGFLIELEIMWDLLMSSLLIALVYFLWFCFFVSIELLVLISKGDGETDYEVIVKHNMDMILFDLKEYKQAKLDGSLRNNTSEIED